MTAVENLPRVGQDFDGGMILAAEWVQDSHVAAFLIMRTRSETRDYVVVEVAPWGANLGTRDKWATTLRTGHFNICEAVDNYRAALAGESWEPNDVPTAV